MVIKDNPITVTWTLSATVTPPASLADLDIKIKAPDGSVTYSDDYAETSGTLPTVDTAGEYTITVTPTQEGIYQYVLTEGTADNHVEKDTVMVNVVAATTEVTSSVKY